MSAAPRAGTTSGDRRAQDHRAPPAGHALVLAAKASEGDGREQLTEAYMPLIGAVARIYRGADAVCQAELLQAGVVGLLQALELYEPSLGTPFWAYASWWVRRAMQQLVAELARPVVLSDRALRQLARVKDTMREHVQSHGAEPTLRELALETGLRQDQLETLMAADRKPRGLEEAVHGDEGGTSTFGDLLADPHAEDAYDGVPHRVAAERLGPLLRVLTDRERKVVRARYGLDGRERSLRELAGDLDVSAERVRQIEQEALAKLRVALPC